MLNLDNGDEVDAKTTYMKNTKVFEIDKIEIDKIRVSNKYSYEKTNHAKIMYFMSITMSIFC